MVVLLVVALLLLFWNLGSALVKVPPRSAAQSVPTTTEPPAAGTGTTPGTATAPANPAPTVPANTNTNPAATTPTVPIFTAPSAATAAPTTATTSPSATPAPRPAPTPAPVPAPVPTPAPTPAPAAGPAPYFAPPPVLAANFYGAGSSLFFSPKKEPGRISIMLTTNPKVPLSISGFELDYDGPLQIGSAVLEVWPVPQKQIIGDSRGSTGHFIWTAQKPFVVGDGAVSYTITFTAAGRGKMDIRTARLIYLENGQPRTLEVPVSGAVLWGQETWDDPLKATTGDLFWGRFVVMSRIASAFYVLHKQDSTEPYVLYIPPEKATLLVGDRVVVRALWTGQRVGGVPEIDGSGPDGYIKVITQ